MTTTFVLEDQQRTLSICELIGCLEVALYKCSWCLRLSDVEEDQFCRSS